jgi:hypothetical protein
MIVGLAGCALPFLGSLPSNFDESRSYGRYHCKIRSAVANPLTDYIAEKHEDNPLARLGVIPFANPANTSGWGGWGDITPPLGALLAQQVHRELLSRSPAAVIEYVPWNDYVFKNQDFFSANYLVISKARDAQFDFVLVGFIHPQSAPETIRASVKIIDVRDNVTVSYSEYSVSPPPPTIWNSFFTKRPDINTNLQPEELRQSLSSCISDGI